MGAYVYSTIKSVHMNNIIHVLATYRDLHQTSVSKESNNFFKVVDNAFLKMW